MQIKEKEVEALKIAMIALRHQQEALCSMVSDMLQQMKYWRKPEKVSSTHEILSSIMTQQSSGHMATVKQKSADVSKKQSEPKAQSADLSNLFKRADDVFEHLPSEYQDLVNSLRNFKKLSDKQVKYLNDVVTRAEEIEALERRRIEEA